MKKVFSLMALAAGFAACAQKTAPELPVSEVTRIENVLSSDEMAGRRTGTPGIDKAAAFIAAEFALAGLKPLSGQTGFLQSFSMVRPRFISVKGKSGSSEIDPRRIMVITSKADLEVDEKSGYEQLTIGAGQNLVREAYRLVQAGKNAIVQVDESYSADFPRLSRLKQQLFESDKSVVFLLGTGSNLAEFKIKAEHEIARSPMANVAGMLPGKTRPDEYVIFSAHHDHIGIGKAVNGDSIYNGANDDAAGTTAVIMLARYFKALGNNERTIIFATFTAEETGGFGSQYFSRQFDPAKVMAMFNIEMIGTPSKWGKNSAFITGYDKTDMGKILQENLKGTSFTFHPDPYPEQDLFYRSDNATLARLGVPAHTISTAKMDAEPYYHSPDDEVSTLDMENMAAIIRAIAQSSRTIVSGKDTPQRVKTETLR